MTKPVRDHRMMMMLNQHELKAIDDYRYEGRIATRARAIRELVRLGLQAADNDCQQGSQHATPEASP